MSEDQTLADTTTPDTPTAGGNPFQRPPAPEIDLGVLEQWTIEDILEQAKLPEKRVFVCLAGDLQAEYDGYIEELNTLVNAAGELIVDPESSIGEQTAEARAQELADKVQDVRQRMKRKMAGFLLRGMSADDLAVFEKANKPKDPNADHTDYWVKLIAQSAVQPPMTEENVRSFRKKLGFNAFWELVKGARSVNLDGGVDVPKSLSFSEVRQGN